MRKQSLVLVAVVATVVPTAVVAGAAHAKPARPRAELVTKVPTVSYANGKVDVAVTVKNKGNKVARKSQTRFFLSTDGRKSADDGNLGTLTTRKLRPKKTATLSRALPLPTGLQPGVYRLIACADATGVVRERKEQNNCKASRTGVTLPGGPAPPGKVTVAATATAGGTVAASGISGGSCTGTFCTLTSGAGTVTFTPTTAASYRFAGWSGCTGYTGTTAITFTNPTQSKACIATFVKQVMISWAVAPLQISLVGTVSGSASNGICTTADPVTGAGSCLVDAGVGTVTLTATNLLLSFQSWSGTSCTGTANPLVFTSPQTDIACTATFGP